jgi:ABC-type nitrate/sulfonate/bicarbonate transport system permease component
MKSNYMFSAKKKIKKTALSIGLGGGVIVALMILWEVSAQTGLINPMFSSSPSRIAITLRDLFSTGEIYPHLAESGRTFILGYTMAVLFGVPTGIILGWFKLPGIAFTPLVIAFNTIPRIALLPLFIIWFGLGLTSKLALIFLSAVFPLIINMQTAVSHLDQDLTTVAKAFGARQGQLFKTIALPESIPFLITGMRLSTGRSLLSLIVAENSGISKGIGYLINYSGAVFQTDKLFACVLIIAAFGIIMDRSLLALYRHFSIWRSNTL